MEFRPDYPRICRDWMAEPIYVPAPLKDPFRLYEQMVPRTQMVEVVLRELRLDHRLYGTEIYEPRPFNIATNLLILDLVEPLSLVIGMGRVPIRSVVPAIVSKSVGDRHPVPLPLPSAVAAMLDLGWGHNPVSADLPSAFTALDDMARIYRREMEKRVLSLLRRWEAAGWIEDEGIRYTSGAA